MEDMDMGRDIDVGSIGTLSAVTGGTFASGNNSENKSQGAAPQYDLELNNLTSLMVQYGVTAKEDVLKLKKEYEHYQQNNQIPQETKELPMQQQLYLFMTKQDEEHARALRQREAQQKNYQQQQQQQNQQGNQNQGIQGSQQNTHQNTQEQNQQNNQQHNHPNNQPEIHQNDQQSASNNEHNQQQNN